MELHTTTWGSGDTVLLVHGSVSSGEDTWAAQRPLADRWKLVVVDRRGYWPNPPGDGEDFEVDAGDIAALLTEPTHLVGHSYGAVVALLAAAQRPEMVRSLAVSEPPAFALAAGDPAADAFTADTVAFWREGPSEAEAFLRAFVAHVGGGVVLPDPLPEPLRQNARMLRGQRLPTEAVVPVEQLRVAPFPKLVFSGGHSAAFDAVCDVLERELPAQRAVVPGQGHSIPRTGDPYNEVLAGFLERS